MNAARSSGSSISGSGQAKAGKDSGRKARPVCIVIRTPDNTARLFLFPITSQEPDDSSIALTFSQIECKRAGHAYPCWILLGEYNRVEMDHAYDFEGTRPLVRSAGDPDKLTGASYVPATYEQFAKRTRSGDPGAGVERARVEILRDAAISYAAQAGFERRAYESMAELERKSPQLSEEFNFGAVVYTAPREAGYVAPPVVTRATEALTITKGGARAWLPPNITASRSPAVLSVSFRPGAIIL